MGVVVDDGDARLLPDQVETALDAGEPGKRVGHLVSGNYLDYIELEGAYSVVKIHTPPQFVGYTIGEAKIHDRYGVTIVGVKSPGHEFQYASNDLQLKRNDELIIMGKQDQIDHFIRG